MDMEEHLDFLVNLLKRKCGDLVDMVIDCALSARSQPSVADVFACSVVDEQRRLLASLRSAPLLNVLQKERATCRCSPLGHLTIQSATMSGSMMEGIYDIGGNPELNSSDMDIMHCLGEVSFVTGATATRQPGSVGRTSSDSPSAISDSEVPQLVIVPTENPAFVTLLQTPRRDCPHSEPLPFSAESVRQLMRDFLLVTYPQHKTLEASGPATAFPMGEYDLVAGHDYVPCLHVHWWPDDEFLLRDRQWDWPPEAVRNDICRFGVHIVPTGCKGSATERCEWRLSFSRAEVVAVWHMSKVQTLAMRALKVCKQRLKSAGRAVNIKSYFFKTGLLWLCQNKPSKQWQSVTRAALDILDFLDDALGIRRLPCFFSARINLLKPLSAEELNAMAHSISLMKHSVKSLLLRDCAHVRLTLLQPVLKVPGEPASRSQLRTGLARALVLNAVASGILRRPTAPLTQHPFKSTVPTMLRVTMKTELERMNHYLLGSTNQQQFLFQAMTMAPDALICQMPLVPLGGNMFTLDAAPLMTLLDTNDVKKLLRDPAAVSAWCRSQHELPAAQRPAGLPADLDTPRGLADLLLNAPLLVRALGETVPDWLKIVRESEDQYMKERADPHPGTEIPSYDDICKYCVVKADSDLQSILQMTLGLDSPTACRMSTDWRKSIQEQLSDPDLRHRCDKIRMSVLDPWHLRQYAHRGDI